MFSVGFHKRKLRLVIAWITLTALLSLFALPWSHALGGNCSPMVPACELMCCQDTSADSSGSHLPECPCDDSETDCDCACCVHVASSLPPAATSTAPRPPLHTTRLRCNSQRAPSRSERPPLPPPKLPHHFQPVGTSPTSVQSSQTNHSNLLTYENSVPHPRGYCRLHQPASLRFQQELLHSSGLLRVLLLLPHGRLLRERLLRRGLLRVLR